MTNRIKYCKVCSHIKEENFTIHCLLTNQLPNFENKCPNYVFSQNHLDELINRRRLFIYNLCKRDKSYEKQDFEIIETSILKNHKIVSPYQLPDKFEVKYSKLFSGIVFYLGLSICSLLIFYSTFFKNVDFDLLVIGGIIIAISLYAGFFIFKRQSVITLNSEGVLYKKAFIPWDEIYFTSIQTEYKDKNRRQYNKKILVIDYLAEKGSLEIKSELFWDKGLGEIGHMMELYKQNFKRKE
jgi:hypothetical protein